MFGIGMQELVIIFFLALIVLGPRKLPGIAKALGQGVREFTKMMNSADEDEEQSPQEPRDDTSSDSPESQVGCPTDMQSRDDCDPDRGQLN